jgi:hypothetical protein
MEMTSTFELIGNDQGKLTLRRPGEDDVADVRLRRAFPWSKPGEFISIRTSEGKEVLLIEDLSGVDAPLRQTITAYLEQTILIPRITHIDNIDVRFGYQEWSVQTDRGHAQFRVQEREDIRFLPDGRYSIKDADGNIYEMPPRSELNEHSRKALEPLI